MIIDGSWHFPPLAKLSHPVTHALSSDLLRILSSPALLFMPPPPPETRRQQLILAAAYLVNVIGIATMIYASPLYWRQEYHNSKLSGDVEHAFNAFLL
ncbi:hypothetical protein CPB84DRAFT_1763810 [Gymnopilus junonius]|uniref:Uncharacterized protein n=1 Tax=Gymnopilus junonius TaxID=109634 RepID=A0A9P5NZV3_GYMJU|nr:hypothetical protein CPB84DRAFT_1763810 [Gymnopilus junonius]